MDSSQEILSGWGLTHRSACRTVQVDARLAYPLLLDQFSLDAGFITRGQGRAYGDSAINSSGLVVHSLALNKYLSFDQTTGLLTCEAGVTLGQIFNDFLPRGWMLPVTPGTQHVTVGGAVAADVHGKNHHVDGTFGNFVQEILLLTATGELLTLSNDTLPDLFWATIGGMGLTGMIVTVSFKLTPIHTGYAKVEYRKITGLKATIDTLLETEHDFRYSVAWVDLVNSKSTLGRSVFMLANDASLNELPRSLKRPRNLFHPAPSGLMTIPNIIPCSLLNHTSISLFNHTFNALHREKTAFAHYGTFFYPLDKVNNWNRLYGPRGFIQFQALLPKETAYAGLEQIVHTLYKHQCASFLAVLKTTGAANLGYISFPFPGVTLALDIPYSREMDQISLTLHQILLEHQGRIYLAKDSLASPLDIEYMYPQLEKFRQIQKQYDPQGIIRSNQAIRLKLCS